MLSNQHLNPTTKLHTINLRVADYPKNSAVIHLYVRNEDSEGKNLLMEFIKNSDMEIELDGNTTRMIDFKGLINFSAQKINLPLLEKQKALVDKIRSQVIDHIIRSKFPLTYIPLETMIELCQKFYLMNV